MSAAGLRRSSPARGGQGPTGFARSTLARCASRAACSRATRPALPPLRIEVERHLDSFAPPVVGSAFAVGGSARALRRLYGSRLGGGELTEAVEILTFTAGSELSERFGVSLARAATLAAGAVILEALQARLEVPLKVSRTGLRHGALLELAQRQLAAA